jgi:hypothetical protein
MQEQITALARQVIETLDAQREYFKNRDNGQLAMCRQLESRLRKRAEEILNPPANPSPSLFD